MDRHPSLNRPLYPCPHGPEGLQGIETVFPFEETADVRHAIGQRAEHNGTMRNGLVPRNADTPRQGSPGLHDEVEIGTAHGRLPARKKREGYHPTKARATTPHSEKPFPRLPVAPPINAGQAPFSVHSP